MDAITKHRVNRNWMSFISISFSLAILGLLTSIMIQSYIGITGRLAVLVAMDNITPLTQEIYGHYAFHGQWPDNPENLKLFMDDVYQNGKIGKYFLEKGSIHVALVSNNPNVDGKILSFRKAVFPDQINTPTLWLCGYQPIPDGMTVDVENKTNIDKKYMISRCL